MLGSFKARYNRVKKASDGLLEMVKQVTEKALRLANSCSKVRLDLRSNPYAG